MKFDCGYLTDEERVELQSRSNPLEDWHPFLAIRPRVVAPHDCRWLEVIERRGRRWESIETAGWAWTYRAKNSPGDGIEEGIQEIADFYAMVFFSLLGITVLAGLLHTLYWKFWA